MDVRLPGVTGPELRDRLRHSGNSLPIVFITGDTDQRTNQLLYAPTPTVSKPFDDVALMAAVTTAIAQAGSPCEHHAD